MCELCSNDEDEKRAAKVDARNFYETLKDLADYYLKLSSGIIKPHTPQVKEKSFLAKKVLKRLIEEWI